MNCSEFLSVLHDYIDGETDRKTEKEIKEHLSECASCRKIYKEAEGLKVAVKEAVDVPIPENLSQDVLGAIQTEIEEGKPRFRLPTFLTAWPMYVAVAACLILFFVMRDSYQRQFESYIYTEESGAVAVLDENDPARSRAAKTENTQNATTYPPTSFLVKHTITFIVTDEAAQSVFNSARAGGTDAVVRELTQANFPFIMETGVTKDLTEDYNKLAEEATALQAQISGGNSEAVGELLQKESQMNAMKNDCAVPELKLIVQSA